MNQYSSMEGLKQWWKGLGHAFQWSYETVQPESSHWNK